MESAFEFKEKWKVDEALKKLRDMLEAFRSFEGMEHFGTLKAYIGILELDLRNEKAKNAKAKEILDGIRIQPK